MTDVFKQSPNWIDEVKRKGWGTLPTANNSSIDSTLTEWYKFQSLLQKSTTPGKLFSTDIVSTYSLASTTSSGSYQGGVLAPNGDIHFVPSNANRGQKIAPNGTVSTYSLVYTAPIGDNAYYGGVLAPNGDIHFVPFNAVVGQKIAPNGTVSTYSLVYTAGSYAGGVLAPNGDIHFVPQNANRGQKISAAGVVSTYSLVYTVSGAYAGGVLAPNGDIHFAPNFANRGQIIRNNSGVTFSIGVCLHSYLNKF